MAEKEMVDLRAKVAQAKENATRKQREEETNTEAERYHERKRRAQRESQELQKQLASLQQSHTTNASAMSLMRQRYYPNSCLYTSEKSEDREH